MLAYGRRATQGSAASPAGSTKEPRNTSKLKEKKMPNVPSHMTTVKKRVAGRLQKVRVRVKGYHRRKGK